MKKVTKKGFTLIELLVVVAIVGLLSSVVLSSLSNARTKGVDTTVKTNLNNARAQAELYYSNNNDSYSGVCNTDIVTPATKSLRTFIDAAASAGGYTASYVYGTAESATSIACQANASSWVIQAPLKSGGYWCIDYKGIPKTETNPLPGSSGQCA